MTGATVAGSSASASRLIYAARMCCAVLLALTALAWWPADATAQSPPAPDAKGSVATVPAPTLSHTGGLVAEPGKPLPANALPTKASPAQSPVTSGSRTTLLQAESWGYQLQALDEKGFSQLFYDVIVMDHTRTGETGTEFKSADLEKIRSKPNGQTRILLSYLSIGEAESYRYYWKPEWKDKRPAWISHQNKDWVGNYIVRFWDPRWRQIIYDAADSYLARIVAAGFDGVYLDRVDVYAELEKENSNARADMIAFVQALSARAKKLKKDFYVVAQNAEELATSEPYLSAIDGIAKEDLLYGIDHKAGRNAQSAINEAVRHLKLARDKSKGVMVVEYLSRPDQVMSVMRELARYDARFIPHFADRSLNRVRSERFEDMAHEDDEPPPRSGH